MMRMADHVGLAVTNSGDVRSALKCSAHGNNKMKLRAYILAACGIAGVSSSAVGADLVEVYQRALQNDPVIREADANRLASRESKPQALSALLPQLSANGSYTTDNQEFTRVQPQPQDPDDVNSPVIPVNIKTESDTDGSQYRV